MAKSESIALTADPGDLDDFDVSEAGVAAALADRAARRRVGRPAGSNKEQVALRIDKDVLARWRASGAGWQSRMNEALRRAAP
ncbi:BrnA antitoxin family protein [Sphingomonas citri]